MKFLKWISLFSFILLVLVSGFAFANVKTITIRAWTVGPDDPSITRKINLEKAGERLNKYLEAVGADVRVKVEATFDTTNWGSYKKNNLLAFQSKDPNKIADIVVTGHDDIGPYATAEYIIPIDKYIEKYPETYNDFFPALWNAVKFKGHIYGVPQDTECRLVWIRKDKLRKMGWSDAKINALYGKVEKGEFTLDDLRAVGKEMVDKGVVKKGNAIWHRPSPGTDWFQLIFAFGGRIYDSDTGKLVISKGAALKMLKYMQSLVKEGLTPEGMTQMAWRDIWTSWTNGEVGIFLTGGSWNWKEWQSNPYNLKEANMFKNIGWFPIPSGIKGGKPISVSHPVVFLITKASRHPDLAMLIVTLASAVDLNTNHALGSGHLAVRESELAYAPYAKAKYTKEVSKILKYSHFAPNHEKAPFYAQTLFQAVSGVEAGAVAPEEALKFWIQRMKNELGDELIIEQ